jgi:Arc/MetJ-type ribon-helix-helix transcriptional regulator
MSGSHPMTDRESIEDLRQRRTDKAARERREQRAWWAHFDSIDRGREEPETAAPGNAADEQSFNWRVYAALERENER